MTLRQRERAEPSGVRSDRSNERRIGGDYLYIDPVTGLRVDQGAAKWRRYSTYDGDSPHLDVQAHCASTSGAPRTFSDIITGLGAMLSEFQERNPQRGQQTALADQYSVTTQPAAQLGNSLGTTQKEAQPGQSRTWAQGGASFAPRAIRHMSICGSPLFKRGRWLVGECIDSYM